MPQICLYLQLHQPYRLKNFSVFEIGANSDYFDEKNKEIFHKVSRKSYLPMLSLLVKLVREVDGFNCSLSCSGVFLEQALEFEPQVISLLRTLAHSGKVEFLAETYHHSLAALYSPAEFAEQVSLHKQLIKELFNQEPTVFRNTELIYSNDIGRQVAELGYKGMLTEAVGRYLHGRSKTRVYRSVGEEALPLLLKHAEFSDDIAFRFSDKNWPEHPLTVEKYSRWLIDYYDEEIINLFMDFETFGEHQWEETGIFDFFERFVHEFMRSEHNRFVTPSDVIKNSLFQESENSESPTPDQASVTEKKINLVDKLRNIFSSLLGKQDFSNRHPGLNNTTHDRHPDSPKSEEGSKISLPTFAGSLFSKERFDSSLPLRMTTKHLELPIYDVPIPISWADVDRDLTAWTENELQIDTLRAIYSLESRFKNSMADEETLEIWRKLQTSDHFYYMCTKWAADGDVHAYFSPYDSPFEAYRQYSVVLADLKSKLKE